MTTRRGFLAGILAAAAAPALVRAGSLMPVAPRIWTPPMTLYEAADDYVFAQPDAYWGRMTLYTGEIGRWEGIRFIESPALDCIRRQALR